MQSSPKGTGLEPNIAGALAYFLGPLTGVLFWVIEKDNKFVRFHAMQSILFSVAALVIGFVAGLIPVLGLLIAPLVSLATLVVWFLLMWKAFNKMEWELPVIGKIAHEQVNKA